MLRFDDTIEEIFGVMSRCGYQRLERDGSRAAAAVVVGKQCQMLVGHNPNRDKSPTTTTAGSKAASVIVKGNIVKEIHDFIISNGRDC